MRIAILKFKEVHFLFFLAAVSVILFLGLFTRTYFENAKEAGLQKKSIQQINSADISSWANYTNKDFQYSFRYPVEARITALPFTDEKKVRSVTVIGKESIFVFDMVIDPSTHTSLQQKTVDLSYSSEKGISVVKESLVKSDKPRLFKDKTEITGSLLRDGKEYYFTYIYQDSFTGSEGLFKEILSTFKFE